MAKIMLVEDDNNLREIYEARLLAEGYEIVTAKDGEEALAMAVKERPDLIIADVMMPKISGFDMLDILRSTAETKDTKVVVMTALSQAEDKERADKLGADRYLVKSQVTLEDVAKTAREVLEGTKSPTTGETPAPAAPAPVADEPAASQTPATDTPAVAPSSQAIAIADEPTTPAEPPADTTTAAPATPADIAETTKDEQAALTGQIKGFTAATDGKQMVGATPTANVELPSSHERVIQPPEDTTTKTSLNDLLAKETDNQNGSASSAAAPPAETVISPGAAPHTPGQIIGPNQTPGTDPNDPNAVAL